MKSVKKSDSRRELCNGSKTIQNFQATLTASHNLAWNTFFFAKNLLKFAKISELPSGSSKIFHWRIWHLRDLGFYKLQESLLLLEWMIKQVWYSINSIHCTHSYWYQLQGTHYQVSNVNSLVINHSRYKMQQTLHFYTIFKLSRYQLMIKANNFPTFKISVSNYMAHWILILFN